MKKILIFGLVEAGLYLAGSLVYLGIANKIVKNTKKKDEIKKVKGQAQKDAIYVEFAD